MHFDNNLNISSSEYVKMKQAINDLYEKKYNADLHGWCAYHLIELRILAFCAIWFLNTVIK